MADGTGDAPRAYVVRKLMVGTGVNGETLAQEDDIKSYLASRLAKYKALDGGVVFVDEIPRNASGKAMRFKLRERMNGAK